MLHFDEEIRKLKKLNLIPEQPVSEDPAGRVLDYQGLLERFEKIGKLYYQTTQALSVLKEDLQARGIELNSRNEEIHSLRQGNVRLSQSLDFALLALAEFAGVLDRAGMMTRESPNPALEEMLKQLRQELSTHFKKIGISEIDSAEMKFDPAFHDPVSTIEKPGKEKYSLAEIVERGFVYGNKVLKKAKVVCVK